jgi:transcriptional regulator with XRE-family HTH domain
MLDMHRPTITEMEAGRRRVSADEMIRLADIYGVSLDWISGKLPARTEKTDKSIAMVARDLDKLSKSDLERVLSFIASVRESKK